MITRHSTFRSPAILSVRVCPPAPKKLVFVITARRALAGAMKKFLHRAGHGLSVVWMPSVNLARKRLEWDHVAMVVLDDIGETTDAVVKELQTASPATPVLLFHQDIVLP